MPELARIDPGGKPYLGDYVRPAKKAPPAPARNTAKADKGGRKAAAKRRPTSKDAKTIAKADRGSSASRRSDSKQGKRAASRGGGTGKASGSKSGSGRRKDGGSGGGKSGRSGGGGGVVEAVAVRRPPPDYPRKAARAGQEGWVKLEFTVTKDGKVKDPRVISSRPRRVFDRSAIKAIKRWRFRPRTENGRPVSRKATQVIEFKLAKR
jgi:protein TonB